jgi:hypothetical protein
LVAREKRKRKIRPRGNCNKSSRAFCPLRNPAISWVKSLYQVGYKTNVVYAFVIKELGFRKQKMKDS